MTRGYLPYRDFFDTKGPYLFLIEYIGQLICYGRVGIFILQWVNLTLTMLLICDIYKQFGIDNNWICLLLLIPCACVAGCTFEGGNLTEEFSLIPLFLCLDLCIRYFKSLNHSVAVQPHNAIWGAVYGACAGFLTLVRITNAAFIFAVVFSISLVLIINKKWKNLFSNAACFLLGFIAITVPVAFYYATQGLLDDMMYAVFAFGYKYASEKSILEHLYGVFEMPRWFLLVFLPLILSLFLRSNDWKMRILSILGTLATFAAIISGNLYLHYFTLAIPLLVISELLIWDTFQSVASQKHSVIKKCVAVLLALFSLVNYSWSSLGGGLARIAAMQTPDYSVEESVTEIVSHIPETERDRVYCYNIGSSWYIYSNLFPCIKYCDWQNHYIELDPNIEKDLEQIFQNMPPKWLILPIYKGILPEFFADNLALKYTKFYVNDAYILYQLRENTSSIGHTPD